jgi:hypothetical protein
MLTQELQRGLCESSESRVRHQASSQDGNASQDYLQHPETVNITEWKPAAHTSSGTRQSERNIPEASEPNKPEFFDYITDYIKGEKLLKLEDEGLSCLLHLHEHLE